MRKLVILIVVVVVTATTAYAAGMFGAIGHSGLMRGDIGKWVHEQVQVSILAPIAQFRLPVLSAQTEKDAPAVTAWQVVSTIRSVISFLIGAIRLIILVRVWRRRQLSGDKTLTLLAQLRSAFLDRGRWYRMGSIVA